MSELHGSYTVLFQIKASFTLHKGREPKSGAHALRLVHAHTRPGVKHLGRGLVFKRAQLRRAISWLFQR